MSVVQDFLAYLDRWEHRGTDIPPPLLTRAAIATAAAIPGVDGAVICLSRNHHMRVPVGSSDDHALLAEQLEYTVGHGPGIEAQRTGQPVMGGASSPHRYPLFHDALVMRTGLRAVRAVPLGRRADDDPHSVLILFSTSASAMEQISRANRREIMQLAVLLGHTVEFDGAELTDRLTYPVDDLPVRLRDRLAVETAVEMITATYDLPACDALAVLRGFAWARNRLIDDVARDLVTHRLSLGALG